MAGFHIALRSSIFRCIQVAESLVLPASFSLFQVVMMAMGWTIGHALAGWLGKVAPTVAILVFLLVGIRMILEARRVPDEQRTMAVNNFKVLMGFSLISSISSFLVGISMGIMETNIKLLSAIIVVSALLVTYLAIRLGKIGFLKVGRYAETAGGIAIMLVGLVVLLQFLKII